MRKTNGLTSWDKTLFMKKSEKRKIKVQIETMINFRSLIQKKEKEAPVVILLIEVSKSTLGNQI